MDEEKIDPNRYQIRNRGLCYAMSVVQGKYRIPILFTLSQNGPTRYNELSRLIGPVTFRTLSLTLKALEDEGLVIRKDYQQIPPRVEYSLSEKGQSLMPVLEMFCEWGELHIGRSGPRHWRKPMTEMCYMESESKQIRMTAPVMRRYVDRNAKELKLTVPEDKALFDEIERIIKELPPCLDYDMGRLLWIKVPRGTPNDFGDYEEFEPEGFTYEEYLEYWEALYPEEYSWYVFRYVDVDRYGRWLGVDSTMMTPDRDDDQYMPVLHHTDLLKWLVHVVRERVDQVKAGTYERDVVDNLPLRYRKGVVRRRDLWESGFIEYERDIDGLSQGQISEFQSLVDEGIEKEPTGRIPEMTLNDYLGFCSICFEARGESIEGLSLEEQYRRYADGRDDGMLDLDPDDPDAFGEFLRTSCSGHIWEIRSGHSYSMMHLYVAHDERGYYLVLRGPWDRGDFVRIALALNKEGLPLEVSEASKVIRMLRGDDWLGITPYDSFPAYCRGMFEDYDVLDCTRYSDELIERVADKIEWYPVNTFYPVREDRAGERNRWH